MQRVDKFSFRHFVLEQHCIPWRVRLIGRKLIPWQIRRLFVHGQKNLNTPSAMDKRYSEQGEDFVSMENLYGVILGLIPNTGKLLDAGCGIGVFLRTIRDKYPSLELFGTDFSRVAVDRTRGYGFSVEQAVLPEIPFPNNFFNCVVCTEVLEHLDDPAATLREFVRILADGGLVVVSVPKDMGPDHCDEHVQNFDEAGLYKVFAEGHLAIKNISVVEREPHRKPGSSYLVAAEKSIRCE